MATHILSDGEYKEWRQLVADEKNGRRDYTLQKSVMQQERDSLLQKNVVMTIENSLLHTAVNAYKLGSDVITAVNDHTATTLRAWENNNG